MLIYIVEDDASIQEIESYALKNMGYEVEAFGSGEDFFVAVAKNLPDLVILDIMLPGEDGLEILEKLRKSERTKELPIMLITAKSMEMDKVKGLDAGADDYLTKPFGVMELISRVKALLRRVPVKKEEVDALKVDGIVMDDKKRQVTTNGEPCELTFKEYELLKLLLINKGIVLSREKIMEHVWGFDYEGESRTVDMHIKTLRQKLQSNGECIKTIRNVGYKIGG